MRNYPTHEDFPTTLSHAATRAHVMLVRAFYHLKNSENVEFEGLEARLEILKLINLLQKELDAPHRSVA